MGVIERKKKLLMCDQPQLLTATGSVASFDTNMAAPLKQCKVEFDPVQSGSGDPAPDNVRPITGWTGANVFRTGKNLIDKTRCEYGTYNQTTGEPISSSSPQQTRTAYDIPVTFGSKLVQSNAISNNARAFFYKKNGSYIGTGLCYANTPFTVPAGAEVLRFVSSADGFMDDGRKWQLEFGSTTTSYEPYQGQTYSVNWEAEAGTVYGGYVDFATGILQPTRIFKTFDGTENFSVWQSCDGGNWFLIILASSEYAQTVNYTYNICSHFKMKNQNHLSTSDPVGYCGVSSNWIAFSAPYTTATDFKTYLAEQNSAGTPVTVVYPPANISQISNYQLNSVDIKAFKGTNSIWSNSNGDIAINYWRH